jgi:hypothetical protein
LQQIGTHLSCAFLGKTSRLADTRIQSVDTVIGSACSKVLAGLVMRWLACREVSLAMLDSSEYNTETWCWISVALNQRMLVSPRSLVPYFVPSFEKMNEGKSNAASRLSYFYLKCCKVCSNLNCVKCRKPTLKSVTRRRCIAVGNTRSSNCLFFTPPIYLMRN